jgi:hypothetical protein
MDPVEIRFIQKALLKREERRFSEICFGDSETNSQRGNEIHCAIGIGGTCVSFFAILFEEAPVYSH